MSRIRLTNETDEPIVIDPGETVDVFGDKKYIRLLSTRRETFVVMEIDKR